MYGIGSEVCSRYISTHSTKHSILTYIAKKDQNTCAGIKALRAICAILCVICASHCIYVCFKDRFFLYICVFKTHIYTVFKTHIYTYVQYYVQYVQVTEYMCILKTLYICVF